MMNRSGWLSKSTAKQKGYAISIDAIFAIIVFMAMISLINYESFGSSTTAIAKLEIQKNMDDVLQALDKKETLQTLNATLIESKINALLPANYKWVLTIEVFEDTREGFEKLSETSFGHTDESRAGEELIGGRRLFLIFDGAEISRYCSAKYLVWAEAP